MAADSQNYFQNAPEHVDVNTATSTACPPASSAPSQTPPPPPDGALPTPESKITSDTVLLALGIASLVTPFIFTPIAGLGCGVAGLILSRTTEGRCAGTGRALSIAGTVVSSLMLVAIAFLLLGVMGVAVMGTVGGVS